MADLIERVEEMAEIKKCLNSDRSEFVVVYGHRRVGKTFLVHKFFHDAYAFHFVGSRNCATPLQLKRFNDELVRASGRNFECPKTWSEAFLQLRDYLEQEQNNGKKVVFLMKCLG